jgi:hypothetical protein
MSADPVDPALTIQAVNALIHNPWVIAYIAGIATGWKLARRSTRYMLGGRL